MEPGIGEFRHQRDRGAVCLDRFRRPALAREGHAEMVVREGEFRIEADRCGEIAGCVGRQAAAQQGHAGIVPDAGIGGV